MLTTYGEALRPFLSAGKRGATCLATFGYFLYRGQIRLPRVQPVCLAPCLAPQLELTGSDPDIETPILNTAGIVLPDSTEDLFKQVL